jgi:hypothetical protein
VGVDYVVSIDVDVRLSLNIAQNHRSQGSELYFCAFNLLTLRGKDLTPRISRAALALRRSGDVAITFAIPTPRKNHRRFRVRYRLSAIAIDAEGSAIVSIAGGVGAAQEAMRDE